MVEWGAFIGAEVELHESTRAADKIRWKAAASTLDILQQLHLCLDSSISAATYRDHTTVRKCHLHDLRDAT